MSSRRELHDQPNTSDTSLQCRRIFGKQTLSISSRNLKAEEGWGEIDISTKGVVVGERKEWGGEGGIE